MSAHQTSSLLDKTAMLPGRHQHGVYLTGTSVMLSAVKPALSHRGRL